MTNSILGPMGVMTGAGAAAGQPPQNPAQPAVKDVGAIAQKYRVPRNILMALEEGGEDPEAKAAEISNAMQQGKAIEDVVPYASLVRATDIADALEGVEPKGGLGTAIGVGVDNLQNAYGSALEGAGRSLGIDALADTGARIAENNAAEAASGSRGLTVMSDVDGLGSGASFVGETVAQQVPQLATTLGPVATGAAIGSVVPGIGTVAGGVAGGAAALAANIAQFYGFNRERQKEENDGEVNEGRAFATAIPQAGIDLASDALIMTPLGIGPKALQTGNMATRIMKGAGLGAISEAPTEAAQQAMERAQAGLDVTGPDARGEYVESAVAGGLVGGIFGGGRGALSRRSEDLPEYEAETQPESPLALPAPAMITPPPSRDGDADPVGDGSADGENAGTDVAPPTDVPAFDDIPEGAQIDVPDYDGGSWDIPSIDVDISTEDERGDMIRSGLNAMLQSTGLSESLDQYDYNDIYDDLNRNGGNVEDAIWWQLQRSAERAEQADWEPISGNEGAEGTGIDGPDAIGAEQPAIDSPAESAGPEGDQGRDGADAGQAEVIDAGDVAGSEPIASVTGALQSQSVTDVTPTIENVRQKAAVLRGVPKDKAPDVGNISLKWDAKENGFIFSRKHVDKVQAAVDAKGVNQTDAPVAAAAEETAPDPTPAQAEAENYRTGKAKWRGLDLSIENKKGSVRSKVGPDGKTAWSVTMPAHYGRILGTTGADGDHVDFYMGDDEGSEAVFVVDQIDPKTGKFDEHKVILGTKDEAEARKLYEGGFSDGSGASRMGAMTMWSAGDFDTQIKNPDRWKSPVGAIPKTNSANRLTNKIEKTVDKQGVVKDIAPSATKSENPDVLSTDQEPVKKPAPKLSSAADRPMKDLAAIDYETFDDKTREDGQNSPGKREGRSETGRWARATVKALKDAGFTPTLNAKGKPMKAVEFGYAMSHEPDETKIHLTAPNGVQFYAKIYKSVMSRDGVTILVQFTGEPKQKGYSRPFLGGNRYLDADLRPSEAAESIINWAERLDPKPKEVAARTPNPIAQDPSKPIDIKKVEPEDDFDRDMTDEMISVRADIRADKSVTVTGSSVTIGKNTITTSQYQSQLARVKSEQEFNDAMKDAVKAKSTPKPAAGLLSGLSEEKQARAAELKAKLAAKVRNQASSGIDPDYIILGGELVALYIEGGAKKFGQMLKDFADTTGLSMKEAQAPMRAAYNHVRDDMDLAGDDISDMDSADQVMAEVRAAIADEQKSSQNEPSAPISEGEPSNEATNERDIERQDTSDDRPSVEGSEPDSEDDREGRPSGPERSGERSGPRDGEPSGDGDNVAGGLVGDGTERSGDEAAQPKGVSPGNFAIPDDFDLGAGKPAQKIADNLAAIRLIKSLQSENRHPTKDEQNTLARYVGWGGLKRVFDPKETGASNQWGRAQAELRDALTPAQYRAAAYSTAHAHYTSRDVVSAMWGAMRGFGFEGGRALEPTVGTGNFLGLQPQDMAENTDWFAAELDDITGAIAGYLYPDATVFAGQGFENAPFRPGTIDVAIGNPPFGSETLKSDLHPEIPPLSVHNYIIAKTGVLLRPGGIMGMVVTSRFLDTPNPQARSYLNEHFNFMGAVRLPNTAFKANAGTDVTTDIVWFQKRRDSDAQGDQTWLNTGVERDGVVMNGYFAANPDMMLGKPSMQGTMYGPDPEFTLESDGRNLPNAMRDAMAKIEGSLPDREKKLEDAVVAPVLTSDLAIGESLVTDDDKVMMRLDNDSNGNAVVEEITKDSPWGPITRELIEAQDAIAAAANAIKNESVEDAKLAIELATISIVNVGVLKEDGTVKKTGPTGTGKAVMSAMETIMEGLTDTEPYFGPAQNKALRSLKTALAAKKIGAQKLGALKGMLTLRRDTLALLSAEMNNDPKMEAKRQKLRRQYRAFVKKNGYVNDPANDALVGGLPGAEAALEAKYTKANKAQGIEANATEAAILSKRINTPYERATKADSATDGIHISLRERGRLDLGLIADLTGKDVATVTDELTSGDKPRVFFDPKRGEYVIADEYLSGNLAEKIKDARSNGAPENVSHLEAAMPEPKTAEQITPSIRSLWMPKDIFESFLKDMGATSAKVVVNMKAAMIDISANGTPNDFGEQFKTERKSPYEIFESAVKGKSITVFDIVEQGKRVKNERATQDANAAAERMSVEFQKWAYLNDERRTAIVDAFNEKMNVVVPRKFDGVNYLTQVGANPDIKLRNSQKNGAWRMMLSDSTLLHHVVGAGKAQPLDAKLLTPSGWVSMGDINPGDQVITQSGKPTTVEAVFPQGEKEIFKVTFSDGSTTECCDEHLWLTQTYRERGYAQRAVKLGKEWDCAKPKVRSLADIRGTIEAPHLKAKNHSIPMVSAVDFEPRVVPLDGYLLGVLLGDGHIGKKAVSISSADPEVFDMIQLPKGVKGRLNEGGDKCPSLHLIGTEHGSNPILNVCRSLGLSGSMSHDKFIPDDFKFNSREVRLAVLQGVMDADGWVQGKGRHTCFASASEVLVDDVAFLIQSFGGTAKKSSKETSHTVDGEKRSGRTSYMLTVSLPADVNPFRIDRKAGAVVPKTKYKPVRYIVSVEPVGMKPAQCIRVSDPSRLYVTDDFIVTHNTFTAITAIMERKRLGLSKKSLIAVPNHIVSQWAKDFYALYPGANILAATENDFKKENRRKLLARIATGDYDAVIIGHSNLKFIENNADETQSLMEEQLSGLEEALAEAKRSGASRSTVSQISSRVKKYKEKMDKLLEKLGGDSLGFDFTAMGVDNLVIDEAHEFKNLEYSTSGDRLVGMNNPDGSQRALDLYIKTRGLMGRKGAVGFLTGTPVSNSLVEIYTIMKYMVPETMKDMGLMQYDSWASSFVQSKIRFEYTAAQKLKERNVLAGLNNLGPLSDLYRSFADIVMRKDVEGMYQDQMEAENKAKGTNLPTRFPTPKVKGGSRRLVSLPSSPDQDEFTDYLVMRMSGIQNNKSNKEYASVDNALWVLSDARKASIDIRTVDPAAQRHENSKVVAAGQNIIRMAQASEGDRGTQLVFADSSVPSKAASKSVKVAIKGAWMKAGLTTKEATDRINKDVSAQKTWSQQWGDVVEAIEARFESGDLTAKQQEAIEEWMNGEDAADGAAAAFTADTGFSFYDDLKAYLVEQGMGADEVAFIHDYATADAKSGLFEAFNAGKIRVLIGSTFKMGAGTNAQRRLVGLHHVDAPWRPSDMEQREGRIIRQGNALYEADPENFEVEILAYTTEKTSDVVLWQVLERKAAGIEQFLDATADNLIEDEASDADGYAAFMAQSTGNPVFLRKMETEKAVRDKESEQSSIRMVVSEARRFMEAYDGRMDNEKRQQEALKAINFDAYPDAGSSFKAHQKAVRAYEQAKADHKIAADKVRTANKKLAKGEKRKKLPEFDMAPPVMFEQGNLDAYSKRVKDAMREAMDDGSSSKIKIGNGWLQILRTPTTAEGVYAYVVDFSVKGQEYLGGYLGDRSVVKNPFNSRALLSALSPENVMDQVSYLTRRSERSVSRMEEIKPEMDRKSKIQVDRKEINKLKRVLDMYAGLVRVAEVRNAQARLGKTNRFAAMDTKGRDLELKTSDDAPLLPDDGSDFIFENGGHTYRSSLGAKGADITRDGETTSFYWFEAVADDGTPALVQASRTTKAKASGDAADATPPALEVQDVFDMQEMAAKGVELRGMGGTTDPDVSQDDIRHITRDMNAELERTGISGKVSMRVVKKLLSETTGQPILGRFQQGQGISVSADADSIGIMRHEIIHALRSEGLWNKPYGLFTGDEWRGLVRAARAAGDIAESVKARYPDLPTLNQTEEMVAELYRLWAADRDGQSGVQKAFAKVEAFLMSLANLLRGRGFQSAAMTMDRIASGKVGGRGPDGPQGSTNTNFSNSGAEMRAPAGAVRDKFKGLVGSAHWKDPRGFVSNKLSDAMAGNGDYSLLALVPGRPLFKELGKRLIAAQTYLKHKEDMDQSRNEWHSRADNVSQDWLKVRNANPRANDDLMDLMHRSTLAQIDPTAEYDGGDANLAKKQVAQKGDNAPRWAKDKVAEEARRKKTHGVLRRMYDKLPPEFQKLYKSVQAEYNQMGDDFEAAVIENVKNSMRVALKRARKEHKKALRSIKDDGLTGRERDQAIAEADEALQKAESRNDKGAASKLQSLRAQFESGRLKGPYFPLARFGQYFVTVRDDNGEVTSFSQFETEAEQVAQVKAMEKENPGMVRYGLMENKGALKDQVNPTFVADVEAMLADTDVSPDVLDAIWQKWLSTMPDQSIRTTKIHRKGRAGWNQDAFRAFGKHMFHGAHQLARLRYGVLLEESLDDARDEARVSENPNRAGALVNEMEKRHEFTMNPTGSSAVASMSSLAFVWYLGATPAAAIVNISQTTVVGTPIMAAKFRKAGVKGSLAAIAKAGKDFGRGKGFVENSDRLTSDEQSAMREAYRRGTVDKTQAHDLASVAETGIEYNATREKWMRKIGWMFHNAERMNREITFLANYRLAREEGLNHAQAIDLGADMTWKIHFDYQNTARPRFMQNDLGKILTTFRQFTVNMMYRMFRDAHQALNGATQEDRREARAQLVGISLSMMAHAGIKGTWGYGILMGLLALFTPGDSDDLEDWMQDALLMEGDDPGTAAWNFAMGMALNGAPGHITGANLTERLGMPNLWFRGPGREMEGRDLYAHYVKEMLGPVYGVGEGIVRGAFAISEGEVMRGAESMVPKFIRDPLKTGRYAVEGVQTWNGDPIVEEPNPWELLLQANGFTPSRVAERYDINNRLKNRERKVLDERKDLHRSAGDAIRGGKAIPQKVMADIRDFNSRFPEYPITGQTIRQSVRGRIRASENNEFGVSLNKKLNARLRSEVARPVYN